MSRMDYDLSGTGHVPALSVRAVRDLFSNVSLEVGGSYAKPNQQFGSSTLFMPELEVHDNWTAGRVSPYAGGGIGTRAENSAVAHDHRVGCRSCLEITHALLMGCLGCLGRALHSNYPGNSGYAGYPGHPTEVS